MSLPNKLIVFLGRTFSGHNHDYIMLKQELPPALDWFTDINVRVDLGYLGIQSDYRGDQIDIPTKKPRKSKKNPNPQLSEEQRAANTALSRGPVLFEQRSGGVEGRAKSCQSCRESRPYLYRACDWRHEALRHFST